MIAIYCTSFIADECSFIILPRKWFWDTNNLNDNFTIKTTEFYDYKWNIWFVVCKHINGSTFCC